MASVAQARVEAPSFLGQASHREAPVLDRDQQFANLKDRLTQ
jgi:hypothetical protein